MRIQGRKLLFLAGSRSQFRAFISEILFCGCTFAAIYGINLHITKNITPEYGAHWIFLPAGVRLLLVMVFPVSGPVGIGSAAFLIAYFIRMPGEFITALGLGILVGLAPYISRKIVVKQLKILPDLSNISVTKIFYCTFLFAAFSAALHHSWFVFRDLRSPGFNGFWVEFVGNTVGTFLVLTLFKIIVSGYCDFRKKQSSSSES